MSQEIQLQSKTKGNHFCYCNFVAKYEETRARKKNIIVECQTVEYDSESQENTNLEYKEFTIEEFGKFLKKWIVC